MIQGAAAKFVAGLPAFFQQLGGAGQRRLAVLAIGTGGAICLVVTGGVIDWETGPHDSTRRRANAVGFPLRP